MESSKYAFDGKTQTHRINLEDKDQPAVTEGYIRTTFDRVQNKIKDVLVEALKKYEKVQAVLNLEGTFVNHEYKTFNFVAKQNVSTDNDLRLSATTYLDQSKEKILSKFRSYDAKYGGRKRLLFLRLHIHNISSYVHDMDLKKFRDYIIDFKINDEMSFKRSIAAGYSGKINMGNVDFPVQLDDLPHIEQNNEFSVNVYMLKYSIENKGFEVEGPVYHTQSYKKQHLNLLLVHDKVKYRYCYIKNLKSLVKTQNTKGIFCESCLNLIDNSLFEQHKAEECLKVKTTFPEEKVIEFSNQKLLNIITPFVVYADFQVLIEKQPDDKVYNGEIWTRNVHEHVPYSFWYYIKCAHDDILSLKPEELKTPYKGPDCISKFVDNLVDDLKKYLPIYKKKYPQDPIDFIPVFIHDLQNYYGHFILQGSTCDSVIDKLNTYFAIYKNIKIDSENIQIRFLDTLKFLNEPLLKSVNNMEEQDFIEVKHLCRSDEKTKLGLLTNKTRFPHFNIESLERLKNTSLPDITCFQDLTTNSQVTQEKYLYAKKIWKEFGHKTIGDYLDLYLQSQVLLLADVFEAFRRCCRRNYNLDPSYYYSLAGFSWDAMLKQNDKKLELLKDVEMLLFIKKGIRGGYAHCSPQYAKANNKYLNPDVVHDSNEESYIMFFDANNAYGYAMSKPLPYGGFEWVEDDKGKKECLDFLKKDKDTLDKSEKGYILEVDLIYPPELHRTHYDYPFCPERKLVKETGVKSLVADLEPKHKYVIHYANLALCIKHGFDIPYTSVHRILKFNQSRWLKKFIDDNTAKRKESKNKSEKLLYKMINICVYGKTITNPEKYGKIVLFDHWDKNAKSAFDYITRPDYKSHVICSKNMIEVKQRITSVSFKTPIYVGFSILELAKTRMYEFNYNFMKQQFGENVSLLYTDNDSFAFQVKGIDCYQKIKDHGSDFFDTSEFKKNNIFGMPLRNKLEVGYFKDEMDGAVVTEFVCLKPKMYMLEAVEVNNSRVNEELNEPRTKMNKLSNNVEPKKGAKGVPQHIVEKYGIEDYKSCVDGNKSLYGIFYRTGVVDHDVFTQEVRRKCLSTQ